MVNSKEFLQAANVVKKLSKTPTNDELGLLYGYYKQATCGDNTSSKPFLLDFKGVAKWEAWTKCKGMTTYDSEVAYITLVNKLIKKYSLKK